MVIDASVLIGMCAKEPRKVAVAEREFERYANDGWQFFSPGSLLNESLVVLGRKLAQYLLSPAEHRDALAILRGFLRIIEPSPGGDLLLADRAMAIHEGFGYMRGYDSVYLALAEKLAADRQVEVLTFDDGWREQKERYSLPFKVNVLELVPV